TNLQTARDNDPRTGWSETPDGDSDPRGSAGAATDSFSAHAVWSARKAARADARVDERARAGRLHFRHPESSRAIQVRRRFRSDVAGGPDEPESYQRDDRRLRHH